MSDFASLCVLSYNRPALLAQTLESIKLAGAPYELIVHDDGSDSAEPGASPGYDAIEDLLENGIADGTISTLIRNARGHNQGQGVALNRMFGMAKGDPIIKIDHDLIFEPDWLAKVNDIFARSKQLGIDETLLALLGLLHYWHDPVDSRKTHIADHDGWTERTHILGSAFAVTRHAWEVFGPFEEHSEAFAEDWDFQQRVTRSLAFACGLPGEDLCRNVGMGYGPSTVNVAEGQVQSIHKEPKIHGR